MDTPTQEAKMTPFYTTDLASLRRLSTERLEMRLEMTRRTETPTPLRYRVAIKQVLAERANLDHIVCAA